MLLHSETIVSEFVKFLQKCVDLISFSLQQGISTNLKVFLISNKLGGIIKLSSPYFLPFQTH